MILRLMPVILVVGLAAADEPCKSGLQPSQRPGPYSSLVAVGPQRGQQHCYICEAADRPVVIVFARSLSEPLGKLVHGIDRGVAEHKKAELRGWVTFLADDQTAMDPKVVQWSQTHAIKHVPLGIFEDTVGPPTYLLAREADVTVLLSLKQRVAANFAFRKGELNDAAIDAILTAIPTIGAGPAGQSVGSQEKGSENLLAGGDLTRHWFTEGNWKLDKDGVVALEPRPGEQGWQRYNMYLWAKKKYADFDADFEYKVAKDGNSGFYFHVGDLKDPVTNGIEVQIYDSAGKPAGAKLSDHDSGGIIPGVPPTKNTAKPAGEWNRMQVMVKGNKATVRLNGEVVNEANLAEGNLKSRPPTGSIGFQDHGMPLWLRNIKVRELQ
jgi:Domain of Unknown Function (DUF1080)